MRRAAGGLGRPAKIPKLLELHAHTQTKLVLEGHEEPLNLGSLQTDLWKRILHQADPLTLRKSFIVCKAFTFIILNDSLLLSSVLPGILEECWSQMNEEPEGGRQYFPSWCGPYSEYCDERISRKFTAPYFSLCSKLQGEKWQWVEGWEIDSFVWGLECYFSKWKSLNSPSSIYLTYLSGDGSLGLDTKYDAIVVGASGSHPFVSALSFSYINSHGSGPDLELPSLKSCYLTHLKSTQGEEEKKNLEGSAENQDAENEEEDDGVLFPPVLEMLKYIPTSALFTQIEKYLLFIGEGEESEENCEENSEENSDDNNQD